MDASFRFSTMVANAASLLPKHAPRWIATWYTFVCFVALSSAQQQIVPNARITDVSAMCSADGITAQIMFDGPFYGKIYSKNYAAVHDCVYYNIYDMNMILFTVPNFKCGTKLTRNVQNLVSRIENEVYVQYDKDTQTNEDKRYLFICELVGSTTNGVTDFSGTVRPSPQTVVVEPILPTRIIATQTSIDQPDVTMEIQEGVGPFQPPVSRSLKLGDVITLVVKSRQGTTSDDQYNMFVHSCNAADGTGLNEVLLIDRSGCTVRPTVAGQMQRTKLASGDIIYYFRMSAFKFPGPNDVYFSCSVDICSDCNFPRICPTSGRLRRNISNKTKTLQAEPDELYQVHDYVSIVDDEQLLGFQRLAAEAHCFSSSAVWAFTGSFALLLCILIAMTSFMLVITCCRHFKSNDSQSRWSAISQLWNDSRRSRNTKSTTSNSSTTSLRTVS